MLQLALVKPFLSHLINEHHQSQGMLTINSTNAYFSQLSSSPSSPLKSIKIILQHSSSLISSPFTHMPKGSFKSRILALLNQCLFCIIYANFINYDQDRFMHILGIEKKCLTVIQASQRQQLTFTTNSPIPYFWQQGLFWYAFAVNQAAAHARIQYCYYPRVNKTEGIW